ncbi:aldehyde dehydrogenase family protein [Erysipelotrichaceae bacterium 51-3]
MEKQFDKILEAQKQFFATGLTYDVNFRKNSLKLLKGAMLLHEKEILDALHTDLGKSPAEGYMSEFGLTLSAVDWQIRHLDHNAAPHYHYTPLHEFPAISKTIHIPYGNVLIMAPWNYPFLLAMVPLVEALAAGNTAIVKTGHAAAATSKAIENLLTSTFDPEYVAVSTGGREEISALLDLKFDYIFFTGGKKLGSLIYESASRQMTPVTLELGGKSPAIVDETANLALAARRIVFGKFLNAGQTCVAPDYVVVHESVKEPFLAALTNEIRKQYPNPEDIGKIINESHYEHLISLVDPSKVVVGGSASGPTLQIEATVMDNVDWDDPIMQEEIFGPILPVLTYKNFKPLMRKIASLPTPLAFYLFSRDKLHQQYVERIQPYGGGCINDTIIHLTSDNLPFGGMGASGIGHYHGKYGFDTFSHDKAVIQKGALDLPMRYNDRKPWMASLIRLVLH